MKRIRRFLTPVLLVIFLFSCAMVIQLRRQERTAAGAYENAAAVAELTPVPRVLAAQISPANEELPPIPYRDGFIADSNASMLLGVDIEALQAVNEDVLGWILIPGTPISYPLLQGDDNQHYLNYTWNGWESPVGAIYMECKNDPGLEDFNTLIYGHYLYDGSMFAGLHEYKDQQFLEEYPYIYLVNETGAYRYRIYGAKEVTTRDLAYMLGVKSQEHKELFIENSLSGNRLQSGVLPTAEDRILTLSTCTGYDASRRWVVQAVLEGMIKAPEGETPYPGEAVGLDA